MTEQQRSRADINLPKVAGAGLAAATAAVLGSFVGVAGTVTGAAVAAVVSTVGSALYQRSLERTRDRVRARISTVRRQTMPGRAPIEPIAPSETGPAQSAWFRRHWAMVAGGAAVVFVFGMAVSFAVEKVHGAPLSGGERGTSVGALFGEPTGPVEPAARPATPTPEFASTTPTANSSRTFATTPAPTTTGSPTTTRAPLPGLPLLGSPTQPTPTPSR